MEILLIIICGFGAIIITIMLFKPHSPGKQKNKQHRAPLELPPIDGRIIAIDYDNGYPLPYPRKIKIQFISEPRGRNVTLIRAYCYHATRVRWFKLHQITNIYDEHGTIITEDVNDFLKITISLKHVCLNNKTPPIPFPGAFHHGAGDSSGKSSLNDLRASHS